MAGEGISDEQTLRNGGATEDQISSWKFDTTQELKRGGASDQTIREYWGEKNPDLSKTSNFFKTNLEKVFGPRSQPTAQPSPTPQASSEQETKDLNSPPPIPPESKPQPNPISPQPEAPVPIKYATSFTEAIKAGYQMSVEGLEMNGKLPDTILPEDAPRFYQLASSVGQLYGDAPTMLIGGILGAPIGAALGPIGSAATASGFAFALPEALRQDYIQNYQKGHVTDFKDFWDRASQVFLESGKSFVTGAVTGTVGAGVSKIAGPIVSPLIKNSVVGASEVATMVTLGSALHHHVPKPEDFFNAAIMVAGIKASTHVAFKMMGVYAKTGLTPDQQAQDAQVDPVVRQELISDNVNTPNAYSELSDGEPLNSPPIDDQSSKNIPKLTPEQQHIRDGIVNSKKLGPDLLNEKDSTLNDIVDGLTSLIKQAEGNNQSPLAQGLSNIKQNFTDRYNALSDIKKFLIDDKLKQEKDPLDYAVKKALEILKQEPTRRKFELSDILLPTNKDPYLLGRLANGSKSKAEYAFTKGGGAMDFKTLRKISRSAEEILEPVKNDLKGFDDYRVAKRVVELSKRGIKTRFDPKIAAEVVKQGKEKYESIAKEWLDFQNKHIDYLVDSGVLSKENADNFKGLNEAYVSFKKAFSDYEKSGKKNGLEFLRQIKDSELSLEQPLVSEIANIKAIYRAAETNRAKVALVDLAGSVKDQQFIKKVTSQTIKTTVSAEEAGVDIVGPVLEALGIIDETAESINIFRKKQQKDLGPNQFSIKRNGKREIYETKDPTVAESINLLNGEPLPTNLLFRFAHAITSIHKLGITLTPEFQLRNPFRDFVTREIFSKSTGSPMLEMLRGNGYQPVYDVLTAMGDVMFKREPYLNYLKSGAASSMFLDFHKTFLEQNLDQLQKQTDFKSATWNILKTPLDYLSFMGSVFESGTRVAEYKTVTGNASEGPQVFSGGIAAKDVTIDFDKRGAMMAIPSAVTAFQNVAIQAIARYVEAYSKDPVGVTIKSFGAITIPAVISWWLNKDDERYKNMPNWQKALFVPIITDKWEKVQNDSEIDGVPPYLLRTKNGEMEINRGINWRFPMPQEMVVLYGALPVMMLDSFYKEDPHAFDDFSRTVMQSLLPGVMPDLGTAILEPLTNFNEFTGNSVIPGSLEDILPAEQFTPYTSEVAKAIGKFAPVIPGMNHPGSLMSPIIVENIVRNLTGPLGMYVLQLADAGLQAADPKNYPPGPEKDLNEYPLFKGITFRYPGLNAQSIQTFYKRYKENLELQKTVKKMIGEGNSAFPNLIEENENQMANFTQVANGLSRLQKAINFVNKNPGIPPKEQRQLMDGYIFSMIQAAEEANTTMDVLEKELKDQKNALEKIPKIRENNIQ